MMAMTTKITSGNKADVVICFGADSRGVKSKVCGKVHSCLVSDSALEYRFKCQCL